MNFLATRKREHSRKPDELYDIIEASSRGPYLEMFARGTRANWTTFGKQAEDYERKSPQRAGLGDGKECGFGARKRRSGPE